MSTKKFTIKLIKEILLTFFPEHCLGCSKILEPEEIGFCNNCFNSLTYVNMSNVCPICFSQKAKKNANIHHDCLIGTALDRNISLLPFQDSTQKLIHEVKYYFRKRLLNAFLNKITHFELYSEKPDVIIPVPLHKSRLRWREFNQSAVIAERISKITHIPYQDDLLVREKDTPPQSQLEHGERKANVENAFSVVDSKKVPETVMLVDDVMTTGNTLIACAEVFKKSGAKRVISYTLIRA